MRKPAREAAPMSSVIEHVRFLVKLRRVNARVEYPFRNVRAANRVEIGRNVRIRKHAWFSLQPECRVRIGENTRIGRHFTMAGAGNSIVIEHDVLISERVFITECNHDFRDVARPVAGGGVVSEGAVWIGAESWLGMGVCVLPGTTIGKHCVIGCNAVVTGDIPDYSVAVGVPAKVVSRYHFDKREWAPVPPAERRMG